MDVFQDATLNQKKSIGNFFVLLSLCDGNFSPLKFGYMDAFISTWGLTINDCTSYLKVTNKNVMYSDLTSLSRIQKEALVMSSFELAYCDKEANEKELNFIIDIFDIIGINEDELANILKKMRLIKLGLLI